jgi:hypothetical protein
MRMEDLHPLIGKTTSRLMSHDLPAGCEQLLPQHGDSIWSKVDRSFRQPEVPTSLSDLRRGVNKSILAHTTSGHKGWSAKDIERLFNTTTPAWDDAEGFVQMYHALVDDPACPVLYERKVYLGNIKYPFPLLTWWEYHRVGGCTGCQQHLAAYGGNEIEALLHNPRNPCWFADTLSWLSGGWRLPLKERPTPEARDNHPSLLWSVSSMRPEVQRMIDHGVLVKGTPVLINPGMSVVRQSDIEDRCRLLQEIGQPSPSRQAKDIETINNHIRRVTASQVKLPVVIKPIKVRYCLDLSLLLNSRTMKWRFHYASVRDAVALFKVLTPKPNKRPYMAKIDLER